MYSITFVRFIGHVWYSWLILLIMSGALEQIQLQKYKSDPFVYFNSKPKQQID